VWRTSRFYTSPSRQSARNGDAGGGNNCGGGGGGGVDVSLRVVKKKLSRQLLRAADAIAKGDRIAAASANSKSPVTEKQVRLLVVFVCLLFFVFVCFRFVIASGKNKSRQPNRSVGQLEVAGD
jgi:hypothetical protein